MSNKKIALAYPLGQFLLFLIELKLDFLFSFIELQISNFFAFLFLKSIILVWYATIRP